MTPKILIFFSISSLLVSFISESQVPISGYYKQVGTIEHFVPYDLEPQSLSLDPQITSLYGEAMLSLGKIDEMLNRFPSSTFLKRAFTVKEALFSSAIEEIYTSLTTVFEQPLLKCNPDEDTQLVMDYIQAFDVLLRVTQQKNFLIDSDAILSAHKALMGVAGTHATPGNYRKRPVYVSNLIPPPPADVPQLMGKLEQYINTDQTLPPLIKAGLAHVQFETIHPFLDGNGRVGRLLNMLMLTNSRLLSQPVLYPSYYFKKHQGEYYKKLDSVRLNGDFKEWIIFYLTAVKESSLDTYKRILKIEDLNKKLKNTIITKKQFAKMCKTALRLLSLLFDWPVINIDTIHSELKAPHATVHKVLYEFTKCGFLIEDKKRKLFRFKPYLDLLEKEF